MLRAVAWSLAPALCLVVFRQGLSSWFQQDDFQWLRLEVHSWPDLWRLLFEPRAQGTIRPLSERLFFVVFRRLFDLNAGPYRAFVFLTQFGNLLLLSAVARRLTGSRASALIASAVWGLNIALLIPMVWTSAYNQILCAFFYLSSLLLFLRHIETGRWSWYFWHCAAFLLGLGALETMLVYPAVLLAFCALLARSHLWKAIPLLVVSAIYAAARLWLVPHAASGPYAFHFDTSMLGGLWTYWSWSLAGGSRWAETFALPRFAGAALTWLLTAGLALALAWQSVRSRGSAAVRLSVFGLIWFVLTIAPVLPFRDHRIDYYPTIPVIGLALTAASLARAVPRWCAVPWLLLYLTCSVTFIDRRIGPFCLRSQTARRLILGLRQARELHPKEAILLTGVTDHVFYAALYDQGPRAFGIERVYLAPDNTGITTPAGLLPATAYQLPARAALHGLENGQAVIYDLSPGHLKNVTWRYRLLARDWFGSSPPRRMDLVEPLLAAQLGPGWHGIEGNHRWMGPRAELRLAGPRSAEDRLRVVAFAPEALGTVHLTVSAQSTLLGRVEISNQRWLDSTFSLPPSLLGVEEMTIVLETDRTIRLPTDNRDLGLAFGVVELI